MSTKWLIVFVLWLISAVFLFLGAFAIWEPDDFNIVALALALYVVGEIVNILPWNSP